MKRATRRQTDRERTRSGSGPRELTVTIERIVPGGLGLGHAEGMTVLSPFAAPGDTMVARIERVRGNTAFVTPSRVLEPGSDRIAAGCPHYGTCGGCDFQHLTYDAQLEAKAAMIHDCFRRIGGIELEEIEIEPSPLEYGYRIRADWAVDPAQPAMGYHRRGSTEVFDVRECPILDPALEETRNRLHHGVHGDTIAVDGDLRAACSGRAVTVSPTIEGFPSGLLTLQLIGERYGFDATSFFQANASILPAFVTYVVDAASNGARVIEGEGIDLFCGVGLFTLPLARRFTHITGVEADAKSASFAHESARAAGLTNVSVSGLPVEQWLRRRGAKMAPPKVVVLDPPRIGIEPESVQAIARLSAERIVYVSCDPATLARDVKALITAGYELSAIRGFDMFPQTHHVETVATLERATKS